jgi:hypothetical protein
MEDIKMRCNIIIMMYRRFCSDLSNSEDNDQFHRHCGIVTT